MAKECFSGYVFQKNAGISRFVLTKEKNMKKLALVVLMAMVLAPISVFAWSENFYPATEAEMKAVTCRNGGFSNLGFEVVSRHDDWAGLQRHIALPVLEKK